jgi:hypothetical protein
MQLSLIFPLFLPHILHKWIACQKHKNSRSTEAVTEETSEVRVYHGAPAGGSLDKEVQMF